MASSYRVSKKPRYWADRAAIEQLVENNWTDYNVIPTIVQTTDAENQKLQDFYQGLPSDQGQDWTQLIIVPSVVPRLYSWDNDAENQFDTTWRIGDDNLDDQIELLPLFFTASDVIIMSYRGYCISPSMMTGLIDEEVEFLQPYHAWDNDSDNQLYSNFWFASDEALDNREELIEPFLDWDTDTDKQIDSTWRFHSDDVTDSNIELIQPFKTWDNDEGNQFRQADWLLDRDLLDPVTELVEIKDVYGWDTDAEQQFYHTFWFGQDDVLDSTTELIQSYHAWDNDADNQFSNERLVASIASDQGQDTINYIILPHEDWTNDSDNQLLNPSYIGIGTDQGQDWNLVIIVPPVVFRLYGYDSDAEQQFDTSWKISDDQADSSVERITLPYNDFTTDSENQLDFSFRFKLDDNFDPNIEFVILNLGWDSDAFQQFDTTWKFSSDDIIDPVVELVEIKDVYGWDNDADQQMDKTWRFSSDDVIDPNVEYITLPYNPWDNDSDNQSDHTWRFSSDDLMDTEVERIQLPFNDWTNDSENQLLNPLYQGLPSDQGQDWTQLIVVPPIVSQLYAWDTDADNQKDTSWHIDDDLMDSEVEHIIIYNDLSEETQLEHSLDNLSKLEDIGVEQSVFTPVPTSFNLDLENQLQQLDWVTDKDVMDPVVEYIQIALITGWDTDAENQFDTTWRFSSDDVLDPNVEHIIVYNVWDNDEENQSDHTFRIGEDVIDPSVEFINIYHGWDNDSEDQFSNELRVANIGSDQGQDVTNHIIIPSIIQDTDAEQQFDHTWQIGDDNFDPNQELVIISLGWDTDAENQFDITWRFVSDDVLDASVERIQLPFNDWTTDSENQLNRDWKAVGHNLDEYIEIAIIVQGWDTDADQQFPHPLYTGPGFDQGQDWTQFIIIPLVTRLYSWDTDAENQLQWIPWHDKQQFGDEYTQLFVSPIPPLPICAQGLISLAFAVAGMISRYLSSSGSITLAGETQGQITADTDAIGDISSDAGATGSGDFESCK